MAVAPPMQIAAPRFRARRRRLEWKSPRVREAARLNTATYWYRPFQLLGAFSKILVTNGRRILETPG